MVSSSRLDLPLKHGSVFITLKKPLTPQFTQFVHVITSGYLLSSGVHICVIKEISSADSLCFTREFMQLY